jgi:hypothetical protein
MAPLYDPGRPSLRGRRGRSRRRAHFRRRSSGSGPGSRAAPRASASRGAERLPGRTGERQERDPRLTAELRVAPRDGRARAAAFLAARPELGPEVVVYLDGRRRGDEHQIRPARTRLVLERAQQRSRDGPRASGRLRLGTREDELDRLDRPAPGPQARPRLPQRALLPHVEAARPVEPLRQRVRPEGEWQLPQPALRADVGVEARHASARLLSARCCRPRTPGPRDPARSASTSR